MIFWWIWENLISLENSKSLCRFWEFQGPYWDFWVAHPPDQYLIGQRSWSWLLVGMTERLYNKYNQIRPKNIPQYPSDFRFFDVFLSQFKFHLFSLFLLLHWFPLLRVVLHVGPSNFAFYKIVFSLRVLVYFTKSDYLDPPGDW